MERHKDLPVFASFAIDKLPFNFIFKKRLFKTHYYRLTDGKVFLFYGYYLLTPNNIF